MPRTLGSPQHNALRAFIIEKRKIAGLTQADVAKKMRQYQSFIARLESGQRRIDVVELIELSKAIGFDPHDALKKMISKR